MEDNYIYTTDLKIALKLLLVEVVTLGAEIEDTNLKAKDIEDNIKKKIRLLARQLYIANQLIDDEISNINNLDYKDINIEKFKYLEEKTLLDSLNYIIYLITKIQIGLDIQDITEYTQNRIRNRLNSAKYHFTEIALKYYNGE